MGRGCNQIWGMTVSAVWGLLIAMRTLPQSDRMEQSESPFLRARVLRAPTFLFCYWPPHLVESLPRLRYYSHLNSDSEALTSIHTELSLPFC